MGVRYDLSFWVYNGSGGVTNRIFAWWNGTNGTKAIALTNIGYSGSASGTLVVLSAVPEPSEWAALNLRLLGVVWVSSGGSCRPGRSSFTTRL